MHDLIEQRLLGRDTSTFVADTEAKEVGLGLYKKLRPKLSRITPVALETVLWSHTLGIAGRCDCVGLYDGKLAIIDYKTSRKGKNKEDIENYWLQTTFYAIAFEEMYGMSPENLVILMAIEAGVSAVFVEPVRDEYKVALVNRVCTFYQQENK